MKEKPETNLAEPLHGRAVKVVASGKNGDLTIGGLTIKSYTDDLRSRHCHIAFAVV